MAGARSSGIILRERQSMLDDDIHKGDILDDVLAPSLRLVICGMAPGAASAAAGAYYAGPGNRFWPTLHETGLTPRRLQPHEYRQLLEFGIGLTDVAKDQSGADADLDLGRIDPERLRAKLLRFEPAIVAFNGKGAAKAFLGARRLETGLQRETVGRSRLFVAPSTSGLAVRYWRFEVWQELARLAQAGSLC
jgi:TDG/mug DNA glycosylase family protein